MPTQLHESTSTRKLIDVTVDGWPQGVHLYGTVEWYAGGRAERYDVDVNVPCVYSDDARYRVALCITPPRLVLVEDDGQPDDELCYLAQWGFTKATDTCANVTIDVPRRVLVPEPPTFRDEPVFELQQRRDGVSGDPVFDEAGEPVMRQVQVGTETIEIPPEPLPTPTIHQVTSCDLPVATPERTESRKVRKRVRELRQTCKAMKDGGTTYAMMSAAQRLLVQELVALTGEPAPLAVPL